jgi:hypothetical protein
VSSWAAVKTHAQEVRTCAMELRTAAAAACASNAGVDQVERARHAIATMMQSKLAALARSCGDRQLTVSDIRGVTADRLAWSRKRAVAPTRLVSGPKEIAATPKPMSMGARVRPRTKTRLSSSVSAFAIAIPGRQKQHRSPEPAIYTYDDRRPRAAPRVRHVGRRAFPLSETPRPSCRRASVTPKLLRLGRNQPSGPGIRRRHVCKTRAPHSTARLG